MKKLVLFACLILGAAYSQAQVAGDELRQGSSSQGTTITIQKDLKVIGQDEELSILNVLHNSADGECRIESLSSELKKDQVFRLGFIYNSYSSPRTTIELIGQDGSTKASIECIERHDDDGISFYNSVLGDALLMRN